MVCLLRVRFACMRWVLALILLVGFAARVPGLASPPLAFHPTRQYRGAIIARRLFLEHLHGLTPEQRLAAAQAVVLLGPTEPPILEYTSTLGYRIEGHEDLRIPRILSAAAWTFGAVALGWLLAQLFSGASVAIGVGVMMLVP